METYEEWEARNKARIEAEKKAIDTELNDLIAKYSEHELEVRFFKDFGCINFKPDDERHELRLAYAYHDYHKELHPEMHKQTESEPYRCYHVSKCKCGFCTACDSSD